MKTFEEKLQSYAELIVKVGLELQPGQVMYIQGYIEQVPFMRQATKVAYECGAKNVHYLITDDEMTVDRFIHASEESFNEFPVWDKIRREDLIDQDAAFLFLTGEDPDLLAKADPTRIANFQKANGTAMKKWRENNDANSWVIVAVPTVAWANLVFPGEEDSLTKLWEAVFSATRVNEEDSVEAWRKHVVNLGSKSKYLTAKKYKKLHYRAEGTDLTVELHPLHEWHSGASSNRHNIPFVANMPTEEVFTTPFRAGINGYCTSKKPLSYAGNLIDNFKMTFVDGRIVEVTAEKGEEVLKNLVNTDEGSHYLGEIALVPFDSPISNTNVLFLNTLFDENAANHLALGFGFPDCLTGGAEMSTEEKAKVGINTSITHVDFMIGCADMDIDGELPDGTVEPIFRAGNWAF